MSQLADPVSITLPRSAWKEIVQLAKDNAERMHDLLDKNSEGTLAAGEQAELEALVRTAEIAHIVSMVLNPPGKP